MNYIYGTIIILFGFVNAVVAKRKGYYFWRAFFFGIILGIAVLAIWLKAFS